MIPGIFGSDSATKLTTVRVVLTVGLSLALAGCEQLDRFAEGRPLRVDPREAFPGFTLGEGTSQEASTGLPLGGIASESGSANHSDASPWAIEPCGSGATSDRTRSPGGLFTYWAPLGSDGWVQAQSPEGSLLVRYGATGPPEAYLYTRPLGAGTGNEGLGTAQPAFSAFLRRVDARFPAQQPSWLSDGPPMEAAEDTRGYESDGGSFTGWKWMGRCGKRSPAFTQPVETLPEPAGPVEGRLRSDAQDRIASPGLPFLRLARTEGRWRRTSGAAMPAFQILGTVTLPERSGYGLEMALVCALPCRLAPTLARILGSFRLSSDAGPSSKAWRSGDYERLKEAVGLASTRPAFSTPETNGVSVETPTLSESENSP